MAYRLIGLAGRMCLEVGLHRRDAVTKAFTSGEEVLSVNRLFWSVYSLDRRWSLPVPTWTFAEHVTALCGAFWMTATLGTVFCTSSP